MKAVSSGFLFVICISFMLQVASSKQVTRFFQGKLFRNVERIDKDDKYTYWFNQTLDHFNPVEARTWEQRFFMNSAFHREKGPVFLIVGGEGSASSWMVQKSAVAAHAEALGALVLHLEHRYYGKSRPTPDTSVENLRYLTTPQALRDLATFTEHIKMRFDLTTEKWVIFGGSYAGMVAAWFRVQYPHLTVGAVAASAPVLAQLDFKEYFEVVGDAITKTNPQCRTVIKEAFEYLGRSIDNACNNGDDAFDCGVLQSSFNICEEPKTWNELDKSNFMSSMAGYFAFVTQYHEVAGGAVLGNLTLKLLCDVLVKDYENPPKGYKKEDTSVLRYAELVKFINGMFGWEGCSTYQYTDTVEQLSSPDWDSEGTSSGMRTWIWQTCTEYGFYQTSNSNNQPFGSGFPLDNSLRMCQDLFGDEFNTAYLYNRIETTNIHFGGLMYQGTRTIFTNGDIDPWHRLGILDNKLAHKDNVVIFLSGTSHCADLYAQMKRDPANLIAARTQVLKQITEWLN